MQTPFVGLRFDVPDGIVSIGKDIEAGSAYVVVAVIIGIMIDPMGGCIVPG